MANATLVSRIYGGFRGVDFRGEELSLLRSPDSLNMWRDYKETECLRTRPGLRPVSPLEEPVYGIWFYKDKMLVHSGKKLLAVGENKQDTLFSMMNEHRSCGFVFEDTFYIKDGENYLQYDGSSVSAVEGYVPTTTAGRSPAGGGTAFEDVNMLSEYRINSFLSDGESFDYYLDVTNIDDDHLPEVTVNGEVLDSGDYTVDYPAGCIKFTRAPEKPLTDGQDNVKIRFKKALSTYKQSILNSTLLQVFDNRVFVSGCPEHPNVVWHSSLSDPTYFSDLDYYREGMDNAAIRGLVAGNNALWVFRAPSSANTTVFYHTPTLDEEFGKVYPSSHSSVTAGCIGRAINFNDDIVFFSDRGMEGISGDITTEQALDHRSTLVDPRLTAEPDYRDMLLAEWEGYLLVFIGRHVYLADSRTAFRHEEHTEYEWFYWELPEKVTAAAVERGTLYLGTMSGVYALDDFESPVKSFWVTPKDRFKHPHRMKTTNKRGFLAEVTGDVDIFAKTDKSDFETVGSYKDVRDHIVCRLKRKKFKDIQLKFHSDTRFSLETATLECFVGGYIKR